MPANYAHITVEDHGRLVAEADVRAEEDLVRAQLRVEAGHVPPGARTELVDAVLASPAVEPGTPLQMTVPAGEGRSFSGFGSAAARSTPGLPARPAWCTRPRRQAELPTPIRS